MFIKIMIALSIFGLGFMAGMGAERAGLRVNNITKTLFYAGTEYIEKEQNNRNILEDYMTAAGKKK